MYGPISTFDMTGLHDNSPEKVVYLYWPMRRAIRRYRAIVDKFGFAVDLKIVKPEIDSKGLAFAAHVNRVKVSMFATHGSILMTSYMRM